MVLQPHKKLLYNYLLPYLITLVCMTDFPRIILSWFLHLHLSWEGGMGRDCCPRSPPCLSSVLLQSFSPSHNLNHRFSKCGPCHRSSWVTESQSQGVGPGNLIFNMLSNWVLCIQEFENWLNSHCSPESCFDPTVLVICSLTNYRI